MLQIKRIVNELMFSNCYIIFDDTQNKGCIVVDPGTEECNQLEKFFINYNLYPEYVFLTHEHTDHTWGCNTLIDKYDCKVVCSAACKLALSVEGRVYFQFYYDDPNYEYHVKRVDIVLEEIGYVLEWSGYRFDFIATPGHSVGSVCFSINDKLFTGDTIMQYKPFVSKKKGSIDTFRECVKKILELYKGTTIIYPGHGGSFLLSDYKPIN